MRLRVAILVGAVSGFIALSYEVLWIRVYTFATEGEPQAFGFLLGAYLTGLAGGALFARNYCDRTHTDTRFDQLFFVGLFFLIANVAAFLVVPFAAELVSRLARDPERMLPFFALAAAGLGTTLPLLSHYAILPNRDAGAHLSYLYVGNIVGSTLGSLTTGLWLLDALTLRQLNLGLVLLGGAVSCVLMATVAGIRTRAAIGAGYVLLVLAVVWSSPALYDGLYEKLLYQDDYYAGRRFAHTVENRSGVVNMSEGGTVYGGGSYDGQMNINPLPEEDENRVIRAYTVPAFHPAPRDILMIGLGSGSWLEVLSNLDEVTSITVVEINGGYVEMMRRTPLVAPALTHPKVRILIDDGRRFLNRTTQSFDIIIQNTIVYWRAHASTLLSQEYLELSGRHLKPGGVIYLNSTQSTAAQKTVATVFPHAVRFQNMMVGGFSPIVIDRARWEDKLVTWRIGGRLMVDPSSTPRPSSGSWDRRSGAAARPGKVVSRFCAGRSTTQSSPTTTWRPSGGPGTRTRRVAGGRRWETGGPAAEIFRRWPIHHRSRQTAKPAGFSRLGSPVSLV